MANKADKWAPNAAGKFYVDQQCIDCDLCRETAPGFFTRHDEGGYSYVHKQPTTEEDVSLCMEALEGCPVEAIGNDGEDSAPGIFFCDPEPRRLCRGFFVATRKRLLSQDAQSSNNRLVFAEVGASGSG